METSRESKYQSTLDYEAKKQYKKKLSVESEILATHILCPRKSGLTTLPKTFGDVYNYLINSKGRYAKKSLKGYKSLEAYNYFASSRVQTVYFYESSDGSE